MGDYDLADEAGQVRAFNDLGLDADNLSWVYHVDRDGEPFGIAHLIRPEPETNTLCSIGVDDRHWESYGVGDPPPLPTCDICEARRR